MNINKDELINLMKKTIENNWFFKDTIDIYEHAINCISGGLSNENYTYEGQEDDIKKILEYLKEYDDFKIENIYNIIYKNRPWNFENCSKFRYID